MRTKLTSGLVVLGLQALAASASAQGYYYYPAPVPYPAPMYDPAAYPLPGSPAAARAPRANIPPEGILPALLRGARKPALTPTSAPTPVADAVLPAAPMTLPPAAPMPLPNVPAAPMKGTSVPAAPAPVASTPAGPCTTCAAPVAEREPWRIYGMGGVSVLRSNISGRDAFNVFTTSTVVNGANVTTQNGAFREAFSPDIELSPLVILGVTGDNGFGARGRFWYFHESDQRTTANNDAAGASVAVASTLPAPFTVVSSAAAGGGFLPAGTGGGALAAGVAPDFISATHDFKALVFDLEGTVRSVSDDWTVTAAVGLRYANLEQTYGFSRVNGGGAAGGTTFLTDTELSSARHRYEGVGPTAAVEATRRLGAGGLALYGNGRASLLLGRHQFDAQTRSVFQANAGGGLIDTDTLTNGSSGSSRVVPVGEAEFGVEWSRDVCGVMLVARAGFQVQTWFDAGTLTGTDANIDLYGGNFLFGLMY